VRTRRVCGAVRGVHVWGFMSTSQQSSLITLWCESNAVVVGQRQHATSCALAAHVLSYCPHHRITALDTMRVLTVSRSHGSLAYARSNHSGIPHPQVKTLEEQLAQKTVACERLTQTSARFEALAERTAAELRQSEISFKTLQDEHSVVRLEASHAQDQLQEKKREFDDLLARWIKEKQVVAEKLNMENQSVVEAAQLRISAELMAAAATSPVDDERASYFDGGGYQVPPPPPTHTHTSARTHAHVHRHTHARASFQFSALVRRVGAAAARQTRGHAPFLLPEVIFSEPPTNAQTMPTSVSLTHPDVITRCELDLSG
jgi:hypothetical protein